MFTRQHIFKKSVQWCHTTSYVGIPLLPWYWQTVYVSDPWVLIWVWEKNWDCANSAAYRCQVLLAETLLLSNLHMTFDPWWSENLTSFFFTTKQQIPVHSLEQELMSAAMWYSGASNQHAIMLSSKCCRIWIQLLQNPLVWKVHAKYCSINYCSTLYRTGNQEYDFHWW